MFFKDLVNWYSNYLSIYKSTELVLNFVQFYLVSQKDDIIRVYSKLLIMAIHDG